MHIFPKGVVGVYTALVLVSAVAMAADPVSGTWLSTSAGGDWDTAANWTDETIPGDGGVATFNFLNLTGSVTVKGTGEVKLSAFHWSSALTANMNLESFVNKKLIHLVSPATIVRAGAPLTFHANTLTSEVDVVVSGNGTPAHGRTVFNNPQQLKGRITIQNGGWLRATGDGSLGPAPETLVSDAITLNDGTLQNGGSTTIDVNRGVFISGGYGAFAAGYMPPAHLTILGPITGPGEVRIAYENRLVVFSNPHNDWYGDTKIGTEECGTAAWSSDFCLCLDADEVIPHGEGKGVVHLAPLATLGNSKKRADLDLNGRAETVNAVNASCRGRVVSKVPGGVLKTCGAQNMDFRGSIESGATVELHGTGKMDLRATTAKVSGELALHSGELDFAAAAFPANGRLSLHGGSATVAARYNETNAALTYASQFNGTLFVGADTTLTVDSAAEPFIFGGILTTDAETPHALTVQTAAQPLHFGGSSARSSAVLGASVACANGIVLTNYVWLTSPLPTGVDIAPNATITYDYADALASDVTLSSSDMRIAREGMGNGAITVPTGRTLTFTTQGVAGGVFVDPTDGTRTYANDVILQGGTLAFDGAGTTTFTGAVSGFGTIRQMGTGTVVFGNGQSLERGCTIEIKAGTFRLPATGSLGAATVKTFGGRFGNVADESLTVANPFIARAGGIEVQGADAVMTLTGGLEHEENISKWGEGTLRIAGTAESPTLIHVRGGTLVLAQAQTASAVIGCERGCVVRVESDDAFATGGVVNLDGGTLDLCGHDLTLANVATRATGCCITNSVATPATLAVTNATDQTVLAEIAGALTLVKGGTGTWSFVEAKLANTGIRATDGGVAFVAPTTVAGSLFRFTATKARPSDNANDHPYSGIQLSEFQLLANGEVVPWPEGTTATDGRADPLATEGAQKAVDDKTSTKWYHNNNTYPKTLTITSPAPLEFDAYQFVTANDARGRDPISWTVEVGTVMEGASEPVWTELDKQSDQTNEVPVARYTATPAYSVRGKIARLALPVGYELGVEGIAVASFENAGDILTALSGNGTLVATGVKAPTIAAGSTFTGSIAAEKPVALVYDTDTIPGMTAADADTTLVNNGVAGALTFTDAAGRSNVGALKDGAAPLGVTLTGTTSLAMVGTGCTYSGVTTVGEGAILLTGLGRFARYFRFTPIKGASGNMRNNMQFSELRLLRGGVYEPWPEGSTATSKGDNSDNSHGAPEGAMQLLDGKVDTKCYWGGVVNPVYITAPEPIFFDGYCWYTGNDSMTTRNPTRWTFEYSIDGENWIMLDDQSEKDVATVTTTETLAYTFDLVTGDIASTDCLSDNSPLTLAAGAKGLVSAVEETLGSLAGTGTFEIIRGAVARLNVTADATFAGTVSGAGALAKTGAATQTLSGTVALAGELIVEEGVLNLDGATLTGVTNIVLKGGVLTGTATVDGDLKVTSEGGAYGANLTVTGALTLAGVPTLATGFTTVAVRGTAFTCGSVDVASQALFRQTLAAETLPAGWKFNVTAQSTKLSWSVVPGGTILFIR